jgi:hypothetical protein
MCCFSQQVEHVCDTNIFARGVNGTQLLVYSMSYRAAAELAMVLPLPVPPASRDDAVRFIGLNAYPNFFAEMGSGFSDNSLSMKTTLAVAATTLKVHDVGSFEASFVPRPGDFARLDERFRIPTTVWDDMPTYRDYGFAVFKLKSTRAKDLGRAHPMAFEFPRRDPRLLFFPTVHVHDRSVHPTAMFDHTLYCQAPPDMLGHAGHWQRSQTVASAFVDPARAKGIIEGDRHCWRMRLYGQLTNQDAWVGDGGSTPEYRFV